MGKRLDIAGVVFGKLTADVMVGVNKFGKSLWRCACECGGYSEVPIGSLRSGMTTSCGCYGREAARARCAEQAIRGTIHGHKRAGGGSPEYASWRAMHIRCLNPKHKAYHRYGGRGIVICDQWRTFENFLADMGLRPTLAHELDRWPNNDGNYEPGNCRWATTREQSRNRSDNRPIPTPEGTMFLCDAAELSGLGKSTLRARWVRGIDAGLMFEPGRNALSS